jgi:hypothetical protein
LQAHQARHLGANRTKLPMGEKLPGGFRREKI